MEEPYNSRGIAIADVDGDGRLDFALANQWGPSYFFKNEGPQAQDRSSGCTVAARCIGQPSRVEGPVRTSGAGYARPPGDRSRVRR